MVTLASTSTSANATTTILYDNNGNTTQSGSDVYTWNYRNQMTKATRGTAISTYAYDENGNRIVLTENSITTYFPNRYYSKIGTTGTTTKHIFANGNLVATIEKGNATSTIHYVHTDHLGGTNVITNNVGTVEEVIDYLPYGTIRVDEKIGGFSEKRKYAGTENDTLSGLNYMMARYQNPAQGRFISQDPVFWGKQNLANPQSFNSYSYAENNPINLKDPTGRSATTDYLQAQIRILQLQVQVLQLQLQIQAQTYSAGFNQGMSHPINSAVNVATGNVSSVTNGAGQMAGSLTQIIPAVSGYASLVKAGVGAGAVTAGTAATTVKALPAVQRSEQTLSQISGKLIETVGPNNTASEYAAAREAAKYSENVPWVNLDPKKVSTWIAAGLGIVSVGKYFYDTFTQPNFDVTQGP